MKKFLSFMLAGLMSASLFVVGVAAETTKTGVVGGENGVSEDAFNTPVKDEGNNIKVKVNDVTHKYAVDLTFSFDDLTLGNLEWNVNDMRYDFKNAGEGDMPETVSRTVTVSNRSDMPVYAYATFVTPENLSKDLTVAVADHGDAANKLEIKRATAGTTGSTSTDDTTKGKATSGNLTVNLTSQDWAAVANHYGDLQRANGDKATTFVVATVTVHISKD